MSNKYVKSIAILLFGLSISVSHAESDMDIFNKKCASCHDLSTPAPSTLTELWNRKAPELSSAGLKYKPEWMVQWLQNPVRIRPAGMYYGNHIKTSEKGDQIDTASLNKHPQLSNDEATQMVDLLMQQKKHQALVVKGEYKEGKIPMMMGEMMFDKFKGCLACHQIEPGYGGLSGAEMYSAGKRLQEDYLISFMRDPQAWDPKTIMPNKHLKEGDLQKLVHYFKALSKEAFK